MRTPAVLACGLVLTIVAAGSGCIWLGGHKDASLRLTLYARTGEAESVTVTFAKDGETVAHRTVQVQPGNATITEPFNLPYGDYALIASSADRTAEYRQWLDSESKGVVITVTSSTIDFTLIG